MWQKKEENRRRLMVSRMKFNCNVFILIFVFFFHLILSNNFDYSTLTPYSVYARTWMEICQKINEIQIPLTFVVFFKDKCFIWFFTLITLSYRVSLFSVHWKGEKAQFNMNFQSKKTVDHVRLAFVSSGCP